MNLKFKYGFFILILHIAMVVMLYYLFEENRWYFLGSELLVLLSLSFSFYLYRSLTKPIEMMQSGSDALIDSDFSIKYVDTGSKEMDKLINVYNMMIDRLRNERISMQEKSYFLSKLIEVSPIGILILDFDGQLSDANPKAINYLNLPHDYKGKKLTVFDNALMKKLIKLDHNTQQLIDVDGLKKYKCIVNQVIHKGFSRKFIIIEELTNEILETEKNAYGKVIRMMAHEVNNSIGAVNSILNTVMEYGFDHPKADIELKDSLDIAINRNTSLRKFMDNFAKVLRLPKANKNKHDLNEILLRIGHLYVHRAKERNIEIRFQLADEAVTNIDPILMEQVITNIIKNAIESIDIDGEIMIYSTNDPVGFSIVDNGGGISDEVASKLFSPFYSTKMTGQGIGLILCRDILQDHKAVFELKTDKSTGLTHFKVVF